MYVTTSQVQIPLNAYSISCALLETLKAAQYGSVKAPIRYDTIFELLNDLRDQMGTIITGEPVLLVSARMFLRVVSEINRTIPITRAREEHIDAFLVSNALRIAGSALAGSWVIAASAVIDSWCAPDDTIDQMLLLDSSAFLWESLTAMGDAVVRPPRIDPEKVFRVLCKQCVSYRGYDGW